MAGELVERLRHADAHSQQRVLGSGIFGEAADRIEALERENATLRAEKAAIIEKAAFIADEYECHLADYGGSADARNFYEAGMLDAGQGIAAAIRNMGGGDKTQGRDNVSGQPHGDIHDRAFHPAERAAQEPATDGDRSFEGAGQAGRTSRHSGPVLGERARTDDQSGDSGFRDSLTAGRDALEKERGDG
ncbi:hypothetical protein [Shinella sp.]|uniref:hypothetical protein n=1 Tax=Shinella sp. TaxID=1870904 RepID=UPI0028A93AC7|nr:hypothetical protein [Shinella sp.]